MATDNVSTLYLNYTVFFFNDTATTEIYTLSLHDALPISRAAGGGEDHQPRAARRRRARRLHLGRAGPAAGGRAHRDRDRKSTRLNSSHANISYAVFCLKKKTPMNPTPIPSSHAIHCLTKK